ncbi:radical SAM family heme chaperone HemW [Psychrobacter cryohalolentis]|uniref:Heme chaperone HemW n=1 Tax=Psychrobacter cryohalolentis (strain ATCC BAA-1226 / DSM 17306 / VKM B-2378 / K5) TaxID=335284 RepID=Q1QBK4_PSYCK|nr:radical SAM family heme chaperone HemW [Psychrobacter cryohalolentis]ABE74949.1 coproporphyrinogen III oxidase, anaerobic [Psychrobacter cryohalolentis K5]ASE25157.1 YggW family oxidoreductase [Psychrobacter cryohalolentis]
MSNIKPNQLFQQAKPFHDGHSNAVEVTDIPLALYIHIPWCVKKCPYCDFNSHELPVDSQLSMYDEYVDALLQDAAMQQVLTQGREISSIFIGGGTPSLLPIAQYQRLFDGLRKYYQFSSDIEITMEANPGTLEHAPFAEYLEVGINRLSIGVQSFSAEQLTTLGRIHNPTQALSAIKAAREAGFERVNVDLMHGLPEQTMSEALDDIQMAHDAGATHISWYQLTIEPNTVFYRSQPILPNEDRLADIEESGQTLLQNLGYCNYEVSAWSGAGDKPCQHNVNYWQFGDYLAIGAGAHGKVTIGQDMIGQDIGNEMATDIWSIDSENTQSGIYRFSKSRMPKSYIEYEEAHVQDGASISAPKMVGWQAIDEEELVSEFMLNALRLHGGVAWSLFEARTGLSYDSIAIQVATLIEQGLLIDHPEQLQPTELGKRYLNQILRAFL